MIESYPDEEQNELTINLLNLVWDIYGDLSGVQLANLTHQPDTPWYRAWNDTPRKKYIPNELIEQYFEKELNAATAA